MSLNLAKAFHGSLDSARTRLLAQNESETSKILSKIPLMVQAIGDISDKSGFSRNAIADFVQSEDLFQPSSSLPELLRLGSLAYSHSGAQIDALLPLRGNGAVLFVQNIPELANEWLQYVMLRCMLSISPDMVRYTLIDGKTHGKSLLHLTSINESLRGGILNDASAISNALQDEMKRIADITQKTLTDAYQDLVEYNLSSNKSPEPFHFICVANYPAGFTTESAERLLSIAQDRGRSGIYILISFDTQTKWPHNLQLNDWLPLGSYIDSNGSIHNVAWERLLRQGGKFSLDSISALDWKRLVAHLNTYESTIPKKTKPAVLFSTIIPYPISNKDPNIGVSAPIGVYDDGSIASICLKTKSQGPHVMISGAIGSGKSVLLRTMILSAAWHYSPDALAMYLLDFKGTEFKAFDSLPHAKLVVTDGDAEFGVKVLGHLFAEYEQRIKLLKKVGVNDIDAYRASQDYMENKLEKLPDIWIIADEVQKILQGAGPRDAASVKHIMIRLAREARAAGMRLILATQNLITADIPNDVLDNAYIRIALNQNAASSSNTIESEEAANLSKGMAIILDKTLDSPARRRFAVAWTPDKHDVSSLSTSGTLITPEFDTCLSIIQNSYPGQPKPVVYNGKIQESWENDSMIVSLLNGVTSSSASGEMSLNLGRPVDVIAMPLNLQLKKQVNCNIMIGGLEDDSVVAVANTLIAQSYLQAGRTNTHIIDLYEDHIETSPSKCIASNTAALLVRQPDEVDKMLRAVHANLNIRKSNSGRVYPQKMIFILNTFSITQILNTVYQQRINTNVDDWDKRDNNNPVINNNDVAQKPLSDLFKELLVTGPTFGIHFCITIRRLSDLNQIINFSDLELFGFRIGLPGIQDQFFSDHHAILPSNDYLDRGILENSFVANRHYMFKIYQDAHQLLASATNQA